MQVFYRIKKGVEGKERRAGRGGKKQKTKNKRT
jgi:hypothetical protein